MQGDHKVMAYLNKTLEKEYHESIAEMKHADKLI